MNKEDRMKEDEKIRILQECDICHKEVVTGITTTRLREQL